MEDAKKNYKWKTTKKIKISNQDKIKLEDDQNKIKMVDDQKNPKWKTTKNQR